MYRVVLGAIIGALIGAALGFGVYRFGVGAFDIASVTARGNIQSTDLMVHVALLMGAASGGIIGSVAGATQAIVAAIQRSRNGADSVNDLLPPARQRF